MGPPGAAWPGDELALKAARNYGGPEFKQTEPAAHQHFGLFVVSCEKADLRPLPNGVMIYGDSEQRLEALPPPGLPRVEVIDELYGAVVEGRAPLHSGESAMATLQVCLAMLESSRQGKEIAPVIAASPDPCLLGLRPHARADRRLGGCRRHRPHLPQPAGGRDLLPHAALPRVRLLRDVALVLLRVAAFGRPPFIAIPVFPSRYFRHSCIFVSAKSGIRQPADLKGKRIGVPEYQMTAPVWIRGILSDDYGVKVTDVQHLSGGEEEPGRDEKLKINLPPSIRLQPIPADKTLSRMLADGELDALVTARAPSTFHKEPDKVKRLFPNYVEVEKEYYRRTKLFPIMHTIVIRRDVYDANPWVAQSLYKAFSAAKARAYELYNQTAALAGDGALAHRADRRSKARNGRGLVALWPGGEPLGARHLPALPPRAGPVEAAPRARGAVRP